MKKTNTEGSHVTIFFALKKYVEQTGYLQMMLPQHFFSESLLNI